MNFDLADLRAFVAAADLGSFHAAADILHLSQPALSRRIEKLEAALGVRLFERTTRRVSLTAVGLEFSHKARSLLDALASSLLSIRELAATGMGEVAVACTGSAVDYFLPTVLRRYHETYPNIRVCVIGEGASDVLSRVIRGEAEFGLSSIGPQEAGVEFEPILHEPYVFVCRKDHSLAHKLAIAWEELAGCEFITVSKASGSRRLLDHALARLHIRPRWCYEVRHFHMVPGLVEGGLGVAVVPRLVILASARPMLVSIPLTEPTITRTLGLIRRRGRPLSPAAQQLYAMFAEEVHARRRLDDARGSLDSSFDRSSSESRQPLTRLNA
jgi:DNA-binding transcriptional LysR family regulator